MASPINRNDGLTIVGQWQFVDNVENWHEVQRGRPLLRVAREATDSAFVFVENKDCFVASRRNFCYSSAHPRQWKSRYPQRKISPGHRHVVPATWHQVKSLAQTGSNRE